MKFKNLGFTLIELLVVISIIGILAGMVVVSFTSSQKQARDTARKSDLTQYRTSLETYANKNNGLFPVYTTSTAVSGSVCATVNTSLGATTSCPEDPKYASDNTYLQYQYQSNGSGAVGTAGASDYVLWARLENVTNMLWVSCSTGESGKISSLTSISGGTCPSGLTP
ncbi:MAG TPA: type II secretion system protein [Patescibacteria group bacterium]|nr:type II secretion system protein [Patescibacteria group bacterium]